MTLAMTCDEVRGLLHALIDGELDASHAREIEAHAASCARCAASGRSPGRVATSAPGS